MTDAEVERILQILALPDAKRRVHDMLARAYALGRSDERKYAQGSLDFSEVSNPYLPEKRVGTYEAPGTENTYPRGQLDEALERGEAAIDGSMY